PVSVQYASVTGSNQVTLVTASSAAAGTLPAGYTTVAQGFDPTFLDVVGPGNASPPFEVCVKYTDDNNDGLIDGTGISLANLRMLHNTGGVFNDVTITAKIGSKEACAEVMSLSPFVVALAPSTTTTTTLPPGGCNTVADCTDDGDKCTVEACVAGRCQAP